MNGDVRDLPGRRIRESLQPTTSSRSAAPGTPVATGTLQRFLGFGQAPLNGVMDIAPADLDGDGVNWSNYVERPPADGEDRIGVACSGGGIRSASFCLGALQSLRSAGVLDEADYISSVSGGSYISVGRIAVEGLTQLSGGADLLKRPNPPAWDPGTPEEEDLRNHTTYLAPNLAGRVYGASVVVYGMVRHLLPYAALIVAAGTVYGWLLRWAFDLDLFSPTRSIDSGRASLVVGLACGIALALATGCIVLRQLLGRAMRAREMALIRNGLVLLLLGVTAGIAGSHVARRDVDLPTTVIAALAGLATVLAAGVVIVGAILLMRRLPAPHSLLQLYAVSLVLVAAGIAVAFGLVPFLFTRAVSLPRWSITVTAVGEVTTIAGLRHVAGWARATAQGPYRRLIIVVASYVIGPLVVLVPFLLMAFLAASRGPLWAGFDTDLWLALSVIFLLTMWAFDDEVRSPLHALYRERLASAFVRYRIRDQRGSLVTAEPPWRQPIHLSAIPPLRPRPVICAAVNVADDVVPPGRFAGSFTFEPDRCGGPLTGYVATSDLERAAGPGVLTLPGMMALSAAAFSPLMGRSTRPGWRLLMALFDVRLGLWLPNPRRMEKPQSASGQDLRSGTGAGMTGQPTRAFAMTVPGAAHPATAEPAGEVPAGATPAADRTGALSKRAITVSGFTRPGLLYSLREALGLNNLRRRYVYITDGGHWENLGLVELLRRGCTRIVALDASDDHTRPMSALGQAVALARDELNVDITIDTTPITPGSAGNLADARLATALSASGTIRYPNGREGRLVVAKTVLTSGLPTDVTAYASINPNFPHDTTLNQFFDDQRFDAYRELGARAGASAATELANIRAAHAPANAEGSGAQGTASGVANGTEPAPERRLRGRQVSRSR